MKKNILSFLLAITLMISIFPLSIFATESKLVYLDIGKGTITMAAGSILAYTPDGTRIRNYDATATYVITGTSNNNNVIFNGGAVTVMLDNCNIDLSGNDDGCAFILNNNSSVSIGIMSDSTIKSGKNCAGIKVSANGTLKIIEPVTGNGGTLNVYGGENAAAIGSNQNIVSGNININYGTVNLYGGANSSALGRSNGNSTNKSVRITGNQTTVNVYGKLTSIETANLTVSSGATLNCESTADNHSIQADKATITDSNVNSIAPGSGTAIYGDTITISNSVIKAESKQNTAIGRYTNSVKTSVTIQNSSITVKSPSSFNSIDAKSISVIESEIFVIEGQMKTGYDSSFVYFDKICTFSPKNPLTTDYTVPEGYTVIIPEGTIVEIGEGGGLHEGNGTLIVEGRIYYPNTFDGSENGGPILDDYALIEDGKVTWFNNIDNAVNQLKVSNAQNLSIKIFNSVDSCFEIPEKEFTIDLNGFNVTISPIPAKTILSIINSSTKKSSIISDSDYDYYITNYGTLTVDGDIELINDFKNAGGTVTFINTTSYHVNALINTDGGIVNLDGAKLAGDSYGGHNDEGCILNITNGGSIISEGSAFQNYGTINADNFYFYGYNRGLENIGGMVSLKNGKIKTTYGPALLISNGEVFIDNCEVSANDKGSGISSTGTLHIKDSSVRSSQVGLTGVAHSGTLTVENSIIDGGYNGLCLYEGTAKITDSQLGGGFLSYNGYGLSNGGEMTVENCEITGGYGVGNSGKITLRNSDINDLQWGNYESYAVFNSGDFYFEQGVISGGIAAYMDEGGTATINNATIEGFDFSWNYDPIDLYGNEATFNMNGGTVKLFETTLPNGFYVLTNEVCETKYAIKDLIADEHYLYNSDDMIVELTDDDTMLDGEYYITGEQLPDFGASIANINESNVTSADSEIINAELALVNEYSPEDYSEEIAAKITQTKEKCNSLLEIIASVNESTEIIKNFANEITDDTTTDAITEIELIISEANALLSGNNLTPKERTEIEFSKSELEKFVLELKERKAAIENAIEKSEEIASGKPTTDDEAKINTLIADIENLLTYELTVEQRAELITAKSNALATLDTFRTDRSKLTELKAEFEHINRKRVNIFDKKYLEDFSERINILFSEGSLGGNDLEEIIKLDNEVDNLIELVQTPMFYGIIRIFWTFVSMLNVIIR